MKDLVEQYQKEIQEEYDENCGIMKISTNSFFCGDLEQGNEWAISNVVVDHVAKGTERSLALYYEGWKIPRYLEGDYGLGAETMMMDANHLALHFLEQAFESPYKHSLVDILLAYVSLHPDYEFGKIVGKNIPYYLFRGFLKTKKLSQPKSRKMAHSILYNASSTVVLSYTSLLIAIYHHHDTLIKLVNAADIVSFLTYIIGSYDFNLSNYDKQTTMEIKAIADNIDNYIKKSSFQKLRSIIKDMDDISNIYHELHDMGDSLRKIALHRKIW